MAERMRVVIAGAGLGGISAGIHLLRAGIEDFVILERDAKPGGRWRDNTCPGCAGDVPVSHQFSFAASLHWRHVFPRATEMQQYIDLIANFGLAAHFRSGDGVRSADRDDSRCRWRIGTEAGAGYDAEALVAPGQLNRPKLPAIEDRDNFAGPAFHSARRDHSVPPAGKRVGVIGCAEGAVA